MDQDREATFSCQDCKHVGDYSCYPLGEKDGKVMCRGLFNGFSDKELLRFSPRKRMPQVPGV